MFNINIKNLKPHPMNKDIYGEEDIKGLAEDIKKSNTITTLIINQDNMIISGHRRYYACLSLGIKELPCEKIIFNTENEGIERLLLENKYRDKTTWQKMQEAKAWDKIETDKAEKRKESTQFNKTVVQQVALPEEKGKTRDIVAEKVGIGSGETYRRAKDAVKKIDQLQTQGNEKDAEFLKTVLNESVRGAKDLSELDSLEDIPEDIKDQVIKKEMPVQKAVQTIRKDLGIVNDGMKKNNGKEEGSEKICSQCGQTKSILEFYKGRAECRDCHDKPKAKKKMFEGIDMEALEADVKNLNKSINDYDDEDITMEIEAAINTFVFSVKRYVEGGDSYEDMELICKNKLLTAINNIEMTINELKNKLI